MERVFFLLFFANVASCAETTAAPANVCEEANGVFQHCGASAPFLVGGSCTGFRKVASRCVVDHAKSCDELGTLFQRIDSCIEDDAGDPLVPPDDFALPIELDGGT